MGNITNTNEMVVEVDIWNYASELNNKNLLSKYGFNKKLIEAVYKNNKNSFHHVLLFGKEKNFYCVIVVDVEKSSIIGHYFLDLNTEYNL